MPDKLGRIIAQRFKEIRGDMPMVEFCRSIRASVTRWWQFEKGTDLPSLEELRSICLNTKTSPSWLMFSSCEEFPFVWIKSRRRQLVGGCKITPYEEFARSLDKKTQAKSNKDVEIRAET